jgi:hypothetical protein
MNTRSVAGLGTVLLFLIGAGAGAPTVSAQAQPQPQTPPAQAPAPAPAPRQAPAAQTSTQPSRIQGLWRSGDTTIRITMQGSEARGVFAQVGQEAQGLGFKSGELSFVAGLTGQWLSGTQTVRYGGRCFATGRKVPMMGGITPNGQTLVIHFYNVPIDGECRDSGQYTIVATVWQRVAQ